MSRTPEPPALHNIFCAVRGCDEHSTFTRLAASGVRVGYCNLHSFQAHVMFDVTDEPTDRVAA